MKAQSAITIDCPTCHHTFSAVNPRNGVKYSCPSCQQHLCLEMTEEITAKVSPVIPSLASTSNKKAVVITVAVMLLLDVVVAMAYVIHAKNGLLHDKQIKIAHLESQTLNRAPERKALIDRVETKDVIMAAIGKQRQSISALRSGRDKDLAAMKKKCQETRDKMVSVYGEQSQECQTDIMGRFDVFAAQALSIWERDCSFLEEWTAELDNRTPAWLTEDNKTALIELAAMESRYNVKMAGAVKAVEESKKRLIDEFDAKLNALHRKYGITE